MSVLKRQQYPRNRMTRLLRSLRDVMRLRFIGVRAGEVLVRRVLLEQAGVSAVDSVRFVPGTTGRRQLLVRLRLAQGCDAREVTARATAALFRTPAVSEVRLLTSGGDGPAVEP